MQKRVRSEMPMPSRGSQPRSSSPIMGERHESYERGNQSRLFRTRKYPLDLTCRSKLGPGAYIIQEKSYSSSFTFSSTSRFNETRWERILSKRKLDYLTCTSSATATDRKEQNKIEENKYLDKYKPILRESLSRHKGVKLNQKLQVVQEKRKNFMSCKREQKLQEFTDKMRRFEFRNNREKCSEVSKAWGILMVNWFCLNKVYRQFSVVKSLKISSGKLLVGLIARVRALGKFEVVLKRFRVKKARKHLIKFVEPLKKQIFIRKEKRIKIIIDTVENAASRELIFQVMAKWHLNIVFIQRLLLHCKINVKARNRKYRSQWTQVETEIKSSGNRGKGAKRSSSQRAVNNNGIPDYIKDHYIRKKLHEKVKEYILTLRAHEAECEELRKKSSVYDSEMILDSTGHAILSYPPRPVADYTFSLTDYYSMIQEAKRNRTKFDAMLKIPKLYKRL
jgi:hypothetical protein